MTRPQSAADNLAKLPYPFAFGCCPFLGVESSLINASYPTLCETQALIQSYRTVSHVSTVFLLSVSKMILIYEDYMVYK